MKRTLKRSLFFFALLLFVHSTGFSQLEFTFFGQYNMNLSFPDRGTIHPDVAASIWEYWEPVFGPILEQQNAFGFGARLSFNIVPAIGIEGTFEYISGRFESFRSGTAI